MLNKLQQTGFTREPRARLKTHSKTFLDMQFSLLLIVTAIISSAHSAYIGRFMLRGCDIASCVASLGPSVVACATAAIEEGLDPFDDAACLAAAASSIVNFPPVCDQCAQQYGVTNAISEATSAVASVATEAATAIESVASEAASIFGSIF